MKKMNHTTYPLGLKKKTDDELRFIMKDAQEAHDAFPTSENAGYYLDEVLYAAMELKARWERDCAWDDEPIRMA